MNPPAGIKASDWDQIRAEYERHRHTAFADGKGFTSRNRAQQWRAHFDGRGFEIRPDGRNWTWGLDLVSYSGQPVAGNASAKTEVRKNRVVYRWQQQEIEEWYLNDKRGLEHGFTLPSKHTTRNGVELVLQVRGGLRAEGSGAALHFADASGVRAIEYAGLRAWDANGTALPARMQPDGGNRIRMIVDDRGAVYPVQIDPVVQQAFLKPRDIGSNQVSDLFGSSVSISGDTIVVGARLEDGLNTGVNSTPNEAATDAGAAYVFVRSAGLWSYQAYLKPAAFGTSPAGDNFGWSVSISGDTIVVGAPLEDGDGRGVNGTLNENAPDSGAAYVFVRIGTNWSQQAYLKPALVGTTQQNDQFGISVSIQGDSIAVGAHKEGSGTVGVDSNPNESALNAGAAYVFARTSGVWVQQAYLKPNAFGTGQAGDGFGLSVAISGNTVVVGSPGESSDSLGVNGARNENSLTSGAAFVYVRSGITWTWQAFLKPSAVGTTQFRDLFGSSVSIDGDRILVGAPFEDSSTTTVNSVPNELAADRGAAYIFARIGGVWSQEAYLKPNAIGTINVFGAATSISGNIAVVGSEAANSTGAAYVFVRGSGGVWAQDVILQNANGGNSMVNDNFGGSVSVSGDSVVVGAIGEDTAGNAINLLPNENAINSGAAFVFAGAGSAPAPLQFVPITPCRMVDTRNPNGPVGGPAIQALTSRNFPVRSVCGVPANSTAYSLNVTVVPRGSLGYLTIWPGGLSQPLVSTLNSLDGRIKANASIVPAGTDGSVNVFVTDTTDVLLDVNGVFVPQGSNAAGQAFYPVNPCRVLDSRLPGGGGTLAMNTTRAVIVANAGGCGIPANATAYATNVTVVPRQPLGFLTLWTGGSGTPRPTVSTLNALTGTVTANLAIVPAGTAGDINAFVTDATDLIVDVTGYFGPPGNPGALNFYTLLPCRVVDTRLANGPLGGPQPAGNSTRDFPVLSSPCNVPGTSRAYSMNATVLPAPTLGFLTLFPTGVSRPTVSTLNAVDGSLTANAAIISSGTTGQISAYLTDLSHLILDINGYFAP
jgi:trimeric autotransporter adhesin